MTTKIFLTGAPGVGKTTVLRSIAHELQRKGIGVGGMITEEARERGVRIGFRIVDLFNGTNGWLASTRQTAGPRIGKYVVDLRGLEDIGVKAVTDALQEPKVGVIVIDEVGPMELFSDGFKTAISDCVAGAKSIVGTIHHKANDPLLHAIRNRRDVKIVVVTIENRTELPAQIVKEIEGQMTRFSGRPMGTIQQAD